jgi:hypothetical protein
METTEIPTDADINVSSTTGGCANDESRSSVQHIENELRRSALQDNIARKGKNAYYFAHAHKATGPAWDGNAKPRLLSTSSSGVGGGGDTDASHLHRTTSSSFEYYKSNITAYSFLDDGPTVKVYLTGLTDIIEKCTDDDIVLNYTDRSFSITINNFKADEPQVLSFGRLCGFISKATYRIKKDKVIIILTKNDTDMKDWYTINDKGTPNHEVV